MSGLGRMGWVRWERERRVDAAQWRVLKYYPDLLAVAEEPGTDGEHGFVLSVRDNGVWSLREFRHGPWGNEKVEIMSTESEGVAGNFTGAIRTIRALGYSFIDKLRTT